MTGSGYSNLLTMILVILIVAILGIVGYFVYDMVNSENVNNDAQTAIEEFENSKKYRRVSEVSTDENTIVDENITQDSSTASDPLELLGSAKQNQVQEKQDQQTEEPEKTYMEGYEVKGIIEIPKNNVKYPVLESVTKKTLEIAVGIAYGPGLNKVGNTIIYGHNYRNNLFFSKNKNLVAGDKVLITDQYNNTITYIIYNIYQTTPNDAEYMTRDTQGRREISLQTCTDDSSGRIIVWAAEEGSMPNT